MRRVLSILALLAAPLFAGQKALTIERIFSDPPLDGTLPKQVRWLPDGRRFSFLETIGEGKGAHSSLWVEDAGSGARDRLLEERELSSFGEGAQAVTPRLGRYRWSPRGDAVLLSGGGDLFLVSLPDKRIRRLTATAAKEELGEFSPDGRWVSFVRDNDLYVLNLASNAEERLTSDGSPNHLNGKLDWVYEEELAGRKPIAYAWSPDSRWLAFLTFDETKVPEYPIEDRLPVHPRTSEQHYPQPGDPNPSVGLSVIEVHATGGVPLRFTYALSGSEAEYLARFGWTRGGDSVWFVELNRVQTQLSLKKLDMSSGSVTTIFGMSDPSWLNIGGDPRWVSRDTFFWTSESSGYRHLVTVDAANGVHLARAITHGAWEVTDFVGKEPQDPWIYFTATQAGPLERQLYRVRADGSRMERLTAEPGTHHVEMAQGGRYMLDTYSTASRPPELRVLDRDGRLVRNVRPVEPPTLAGYALGTIEFVMVEGADGTPLYGSLIKAADFDPKKRYPVVVYVYGGPHAQVVRDAWGGQRALFHRYLASRGFLVFSLDNRGSAGRGRAFEHALLGRFGKVELEGQLAGVAYLKTLPYVDGSRIGIWGWSYGGFMTCYALTNSSGVFKAGVAVAPVTDWRLYDSIYTERYLKLPSENPDGYRDSSPITRAEDLSGALLLVHGTSDDNVHWGNTVAFIDRLYKAGKVYDLQLYPNLKHDIAGKLARIQLYSRIAEHFIRHLGS
jgi:dipeptidyl-peptidase-4